MASERELAFPTLCREQITALRREFTMNEDETMSDARRGIDPTVPPSGDGCAECLATGGWWFHLRRCAQCGHVGCCDSSPSQHASKHFAEAGHSIIASFEPGEEWFYDYETGGAVRGAELAPPHAHPPSQPVPGPAGRVPPDWESRLH